MKIAIIGAGALGIMFGASLSYDNEVVLLDVIDPVIEKINNEGIICYDNEKIIKGKVKAYKSGTLNEKFDLVIILTKTNYSKNSIESNLNLFTKDTYLMTVQNGLGNKELLNNYVDDKHLIIAVTKNNAVKLDANVARRSNHNVTTFGYNEDNKNFVEKLSNIFIKANFESRLSDNIDALVWEKVFLNLAVNPYCAYYNKNLKDFVNDENLWPLAKKTIKEAVDIANKLGQNFDYENISKHIHNEMNLVNNGYPSMWQDVTNKRLTEINSLNGKVVELGKSLNMDVSENERITNCIKQLESSYKK